MDRDGTDGHAQGHIAAGRANPLITLSRFAEPALNFRRALVSMALTRRDGSLPNLHRHIIPLLRAQ